MLCYTIGLPYIAVASVSSAHLKLLQESDVGGGRGRVGRRIRQQQPSSSHLLTLQVGHAHARPLLLYLLSLCLSLTTCCCFCCSPHNIYHTYNKFKARYIKVLPHTGHTISPHPWIIMQHGNHTHTHTHTTPHHSL